MAQLPVTARCQVTRGAGQGVPISGYSQAGITAQVTCSGSLAGGAARSEPQRPSAAAAPSTLVVLLPLSTGAGAGWCRGGRGCQA